MFKNRVTLPKSWEACEMSTNVMFKGEVYAITGMSSFLTIGEKPEEETFTILFNLEAIEAARPFVFSRCIMVRREAFVWLPSSINFEDSEWTQGKQSG